MHRLRFPIRRRAPLAHYGLVALACLLLVIGLDLLTNTLDTDRYYWDFALYYDMAEYGLAGNDNLWAPFVYRFATPLLAGGIAHALPIEQTLAVSLSSEGGVFTTSTAPGFTVIAYLGAVAQLVAVYWLAQLFGARGWRAFVPVLAIAFSLYNVKFLLFDISRPDHLAYPLMIVALVAVIQRRVALALIVTCVGLTVREFLAIPAAILVLLLAWDYWRTRDRTRLGWAALVVVAVGAAIVLPRLLIPIQGSGQYIDPLNQSAGDTLTTLVQTLKSRRRWINLLFNLVSYLLPLWLLLTPRRARRLWEGLRGVRVTLALYTALVLGLALYGGTDLWRFMTYLLVPLAIGLAVLLREDVHPAEIAYMLGAVLYYNKILLPIPNEIEAYLDFYGGYDIRVNGATVERLITLAALGAGAILLRGLLALHARRDRTIRRDAPAKNEASGP